MSNQEQGQDPENPIPVPNLPRQPRRIACAACRHSHHRCQENCILAPFFPADGSQDFANANRLYGVAKLVEAAKAYDVQEDREIVIRSMIYEANMRALYPLGGCFQYINELEQKLNESLMEIADLKSREQFLNPTGVNIQANLQPYAHVNASNTIVGNATQNIHFQYPNLGVNASVNDLNSGVENSIGNSRMKYPNLVDTHQLDMNAREQFLNPLCVNIQANLQPYAHVNDSSSIVGNATQNIHFQYPNLGVNASVNDLNSGEENLVGTTRMQYQPLGDYLDNTTSPYLADANGNGNTTANANVNVVLDSGLENGMVNMQYLNQYQNVSTNVFHDGIVQNMNNDFGPVERVRGLDEASRTIVEKGESSNHRSN